VPRAAALIALTALSILASGSQALAKPTGPRHTIGRGTSTNWSGYDVTGRGATHVIGTWTQPAAACAARENSWSSPWVGLDGDGSNTVEQIGTDSDCSNGVPYYYAWYEMYPKGVVQIPVTVTPAHSYTGEVTYTGSSFVLRLADNTGGGAPYSTTQVSRKGARVSAEWIMEGPSNGLLTDFGTLGVTGAAATINGRAGSLATLGAAPITMITNTGAPRAVPSPLGGDGASFSVAWTHS